ncbi:uncharacterized protein LOC127241873 isoform X2 [Andrographis paniculata]|uniref:uncharacterized protein LOC127241873 isoform X2 n=1 Tax=Andrographis paniculata TaxID=175694 RepID=UPI0021E7E313|nr:uncharacterized protein LOC127241873 isoform X2 [Andrographis paniculata]
MNSYAYQRNTLMESCFADGVVCPKPRRIGVPMQFYEPLRPPSRLLHINNQQTEAYDARAATELLDIIQTKGNPSSEWPSFLHASSPPFFAGSPPTRASNPIIQDKNFGQFRVQSRPGEDRRIRLSPDL